MKNLKQISALTQNLKRTVNYCDQSSLDRLSMLIKRGDQYGILSDKAFERKFLDGFLLQHRC